MADFVFHDPHHVRVRNFEFHSGPEQHQTKPSRTKFYLIFFSHFSRRVESSRLFDKVALPVVVRSFAFTAFHRQPLSFSFSFSHLRFPLSTHSNGTNASSGDLLSQEHKKKAGYAARVRWSWKTEDSKVFTTRKDAAQRLNEIESPLNIKGVTVSS